MGKDQKKWKDDKTKSNQKAKLVPKKTSKQTPQQTQKTKKTSKQTPRQTQKKKKTDEKSSPEELRDRRSHKGGELNTWDPAQLPIAHELWKKQQEPGYTGKHYSIRGLHRLTGIPYTTLRSVYSSQN